MKHRRLAAAAMAAAIALTQSAGMTAEADNNYTEGDTYTAYEDENGYSLYFNGNLYEYFEEDGNEYVVCEGVKYMFEDDHVAIVSGNDTEDYVYLKDRIPLRVTPGQILKNVPCLEVTRIADEAFKGNSHLYLVNLPDTLTRVGYRAFYGCGYLKYVEYPSTLTDIGGEAFSCTPFADLCSKYDGAIVINGTAVGFRNAATVMIPEGTKRIADHFAENSGIEFVSIPEGVEEIGENAFAGCQYINGVSLPKSLEKIGKNAFYHSHQRDIYYAGSKTDFGLVEIGEGNDCFDTDYHMHYQKAYPLQKKDSSGLEYNICGYKAELAHCDPDVLGEVDICESFAEFEGITAYTTSIGEKAFSGCRSMVSVRIPHMVDSIAISAFEGCTALRDVYYDGTKDKWDKMLSKPVLSDNVTIHFSDMRYSDSELYGSTGVLSDGRDSYGDVYVGKNFTSIAHNAFEGNRDIISVVINQSVTEIGERAFADCANLKEVSLTGKAVHFGKEIFSGCCSLADLWFYGTEEEWSAIEADVDLPKGVSVHFIENIRETSSIVVEDNVLVNGSHAKGKIVVPDGVTRIADEAFMLNKDITSVTLPDSIESIGDNAFTGCSALTEVIAPDKYIELTNHSFGTDEGNRPPWYAELLESDRPVFGQTLLAVPNAEEYTVPEGVRSIFYIGSSNFDLKKLTISEGVEEISNSFCNCFNLEEVNLPSTLRDVSFSFNSVFNLTKVSYAGRSTDWDNVSIEFSFENGGIPAYDIDGVPLSTKENKYGQPEEQYAETSKPFVRLEDDVRTGLKVGDSVTFRVCGRSYDIQLSDKKGKDVICYDVTEKEAADESGATIMTYTVKALSPGEADFDFLLDSQSSPSLSLSFHVSEDGAEPQIRKGDANCDGKVTVADAVAVLQYIANKQKYPLTADGIANADIDGAEGITGGDATMIQKIDAGLC